jgi:hypothetical protein
MRAAVAPERVERADRARHRPVTASGAAGCTVASAPAHARQPALSAAVGHGGSTVDTPPNNDARPRSGVKLLESWRRRLDNDGTVVQLLRFCPTVG